MKKLKRTKKEEEEMVLNRARLGQAAYMKKTTKKQRTANAKKAALIRWAKRDDSSKKE